MKLIVNRFQGSKTQNDSLWYGGKVAEIITDNETYTIIANGEVRCELIAKHDIEINDYNFKKGEVVLNIIDKNNSGKFKYEIESFITNDNELLELINNNNPDFELEIGNNNWLEVFYEKDETNESDVLDCSNIDEAINDILEEIKDTIKIENENIIYCRSALQNDSYSGSLCKNTIEKIAYGMDLSYSELNKLLEEYHPNGFNSKKTSDEIIIYKNSKLYGLFKDIQDFNDEKIDILHNIALQLKK